jgi:phage/plasmid-like protein (TIGR03299 family)
MSHDLTERDDGTVEMFSAGPTPVWHRLGQRTQTQVTSEAAMRLARLDWRVEKRPLMLADGDSADFISTHQAVVRCDNGAVLGIVSPRYTPLQNHEAFEWLDEVVGERLAIYETAGSLHGGRTVWMMVRLPSAIWIRGTHDVTQPYILLCNGHDGARALRVFNTSVRVVCNNTLTWAMTRGTGQGLCIRHTRSLKHRIEQARSVLGIAQQEQREKQREMEALARRPLRAVEARQYFECVWPDDPEVLDNDNARRVRTQMAENFALEGDAMPAVAGTAWAAYNAVSRYTDWQRPARGRTPRQIDDSRLSSIWFGDSAALKRRAWGQALALAGRGPAPPAGRSRMLAATHARGTLLTT